MTTTLTIGSTVRILPAGNALDGKFGVISKIRPQFGEQQYGVEVGYDWAVVYFALVELEQVYTLMDALNGVDNAIATATNADGTTIEVSYHHNMPGGSPFWVWLEVDKATKPVDRVVAAFDLFNRDVRMSFDFAELGEDIYGDFALDIDAAIWARQAKQEA